VVASNLRAAASGRRFERQQGMHALWDQRAHALDYLVYGYLQLGRGREAEAVAAELKEVKETFPAGELTSNYALAAGPARVALEQNRWAEAAALPLRPAPSWPGAEAITHFARSIGAARIGRTARASSEVDTLAQLERALAGLGGQQTYWSAQVAIQRLAAGAWVALATGDTATALQQASDAADREDGTEKHPVTPGPVLPARELYADLLLAIGRPDDAKRQYQAVLHRQPGRARSLAGLAMARTAGARAAR
jgi:hypothetical protein